MKTMKLHNGLNKNYLKSLNIPNTENVKDAAANKKGSLLGIRYLQCFLLFSGLSVAFATRVNLSVAIVAMTDSQATNPQYDEFPWDENTKSLLLSSFFWGYVITQVPAGQLAHKFGGKVMFLTGILISSSLNVLIPICARFGDWQLVCALRVAQGLSQGFLMPSAHTILASWAPVEERGILSTYAYAGIQFGTVIMLASSGIMASSAMGWPSIFYISGGVGLVWSAAFFIWGASSPSEYKNISAKEKKFIELSLGSQDEEKTFKSALKTPWTKIFTSVPFMVLTLAHCTNNWGFSTLLTEIPSYMKNILNMDINSNALLSALPYAAMLILCLVFSIIQNLLSKRKCISLSVSRKLFNSLGHWIPMLSLITLGYVTADQKSLAILLLTVTVGVSSATYLGFQVNHIDLSPNFAGILMGITNCAANIMSIIAPLIVGFIVTNEKDPHQWRIIFFIAAGFYFIGNLCFVLFGETKVQPWNNFESGQLQKNSNSTSVESKH